MLDEIVSDYDFDKEEKNIIDIISRHNINNTITLLSTLLYLTNFNKDVFSGFTYSTLEYICKLIVSV
jgi:hypothetical protein